MKKILFILLILVAAFKLNAQDYTLIGKSIKIYDQIGTEYRYFDTRNANIQFYMGTSGKTWILIVDESYILGFYDATFYTKKDKEIKEKDVNKMVEKGKVDHYILASNFSSNGNAYIFYIPFDLSYVQFIETEHNKNYMFYFDVTKLNQDVPQLPTMKDYK